MRERNRVIDLSGPDGNVFAIAGLAQSWSRQIGNGNTRGCILEATTARLGGVEGDYNDVLDTFDEWFSGIDYVFLNDPRKPGDEDE